MPDWVTYDFRFRRKERGMTAYRDRMQAGEYQADPKAKKPGKDDEPKAEGTPKRKPGRPRKTPAE